MPDINCSIIIPHYNIPYMLEKLLETTPYDKNDVEIIVVDDRSDRDIEKLLKVKARFKKHGVKFFRNNKGKKGAGTCRNIGLKHAIGKWLLFADADDCFKMEMYDVVEEYFENPEDIIFFRWESADENGKVISGRAEGYNKKIDAFADNKEKRNELLLRYDMPGPVSKLIKSDLVERNHIRFDEITVSNDVMFSTKCGFYAKNIEVSRNCIYQVTERNCSLTTTFDEKKFRIRTDVFVKMCKFLKDHLDRDDWKDLGFNGNIRLIDAYQKKYGMKILFYIFFKLLLNGIAPVSFKGMSIKTAPGTLKTIISARSKIINE